MTQDFKKKNFYAAVVAVGNTAKRNTITGRLVPSARNTKLGVGSRAAGFLSSAVSRIQSRMLMHCDTLSKLDRPLPYI